MPGFKPDDPEPPSQVPAWLSPAARVIFSDLTADLCAAGVPIKPIDQHALAAASHTLAEMQESVLRERAARDIDSRILIAATTKKLRAQALTWLEMLGATPRSRARLYLSTTGTTKQPAAGSVMAILKEKADRDRTGRPN